MRQHVKYRSILHPRSFARSFVVAFLARAHRATRLPCRKTHTVFLQASRTSAVAVLWWIVLHVRRLDVFAPLATARRCARPASGKTNTVLFQASLGAVARHATLGREPRVCHHGARQAPGAAGEHGVDVETQQPFLVEKTRQGLGGDRHPQIMNFGTTISQNVLGSF